MVEVDEARFEELVSEGIDAISKDHFEHLDNLAFTIADLPTPYQLRKAGMRHGWLLLGLYEGIPKTVRGNNYSGVLPDKITIFRRPLMAISRDEDDLRERVKSTVWHEVAHHFGLNHHDISQREGA